MPAFLRGDFVERLGWITGPQLVDAVSVGQVAPGPVFTAMRARTDAERVHLVSTRDRVQHFPPGSTPARPPTLCAGRIS